MLKKQDKNREEAKKEEQLKTGGKKKKEKTAEKAKTGEPKKLKEKKKKKKLNAPQVDEDVMIRLEDVSKTYPVGKSKKNEGNHALNHVDLTIRKGEFVFVLGHSGAGKSTFLKLILREEVATEGSVYVNGFDLTRLRQKKISQLRRSMGVVFQDFRLIPTMTAYDNVAFAMRVTNVAEPEIAKRVPFVLKLVGLSAKANSYPPEMSGGEQQRIALARALVHSPPLIIADEPTGNIDPELSVEMMELLAAINAVGVTVVVVTHEHELAARFNKRIIQIEKGRVVADSQNGDVILPVSEETEEEEMQETEPAASENPDAEEFTDDLRDYYEDGADGGADEDDNEKEEVEV